LTSTKTSFQQIAELEEILKQRPHPAESDRQGIKDCPEGYSRTSVVHRSSDEGIELTLEDLIADEDVAITLTHSVTSSARRFQPIARMRRGGSVAKRDDHGGRRTSSHICLLLPLTHT
jgi:DNA gyrase/topoisomerase IV subunit A